MAAEVADVLWALHDFEAEQPDEVSFKAGEKIVVVEKDDEFSDGWYTGTNESGHTGLFPFAYTTTDHSLAQQSKLASTHLHTGAEQAATTTTTSTSADSALHPPSTSASTSTSTASKPARRNSADTDNFSITDTDAENVAAANLGSSSEYVPPSGGRAALAASAKRNAAQENASEREAEARRRASAQQQFEQEEDRQRALLEAAAVSKPSSQGGEAGRKHDDTFASYSLNPLSSSSAAARASAIPRTAGVAGTNVSYESDDSENEDDNGFDFSQLKHIHAPIFGGNAATSSSSATATPRLNGGPGSSTSANLQAAAAAPSALSSSPIVAPATSAVPIGKLSSPATIAALPPSLPTIEEPTSSTTSLAAPQQATRNNSTTSETGTVRLMSSNGVSPTTTATSTPALAAAAAAGPISDPHEWTVDEVIEWGRAKGWDDATVLDKFREHEISGDVLMEMDVVILKEIDIVAYGKRLKVANAIKELKRSLRETGSGHGEDGMAPHTPGNESGQRTPAHVHITPRRASLGLADDFEQLQSPLYPPAGATAPNSATSAQFAHMPPPAGPPGTGPYVHSYNGYPVPLFGSGLGGANANTNAGLGSRASVISASGSAGRGGPNHSRVDSVDRPRSAGGHSLTGSFGGSGLGSAGAAGGSGWPRSGPLELGFSTIGGAPHGRALTDQGGASSARGSTNGSVRNMQLDGTTAASSMDGSREGESYDRAGTGGGGFLSGLGRNSASSGGAKSGRLSKASAEGGASPQSPNLRAPGSGGGASGRGVGHGERTSFFGLGPRNRKPAPKEVDGKGGTLSRLGIGKGASSKQDRTSSIADLKDRISLPTSSPSYETSTGSGIGISGAGLGATGDTSPTNGVSYPSDVLSTPGGGGGDDTVTMGPRGNGRPGHEKSASVGSVGPEWNGIGTGPTSPLSPSAGVVGGPDSGPVMARIRPVDFEGWIKKKTERYGTWKPRYMALKGPDLVLLRDPTAEKIKGYVSMKGYKVIADENTNPGKYGFKILHEHEKPHYFSSDDPILVREWMKALMKSTIGRDHSFPVISSYNNATISLREAQRMNPPPRPPSPTSRARVQRANARPNTQTLSAKDASVLMGLSSPSMPGRM
ncbi:unnamed protein product [Tilletia controversa]|uniref:Uncharacterized protein n=3 Tax=Tilletia TaxID=13289 RepID=A0A8X7MWJ1_9BASI|nr:hypothetical protein CF336_g3256 [Tilletia laevis]KAE8200233.1 hypothetical protein CF328_g3023 [Tilletia controversa]KAE8262166.1 hypothetical protein A4X03_0g2669 [Tilletia caries]KAE8205103.1 hypothetical protein CF335_g2422 [Tilletia laevis]KAE8249893.1 hypothetical protein A4X06_0g3022 [Tilletia controversa]